MFTHLTTIEQQVPRATRYPLTLPVRFRARGESQWSVGISVNISHTGLLFDAGRAVDARQPLEIEVVLPGDDQASARVVARATVRRAPAADSDHDQALAVALDGWELVRIQRHVD